MTARWPAILLLALGLTGQAVSLIRVVFGLMAGGSALALLCFARKRWFGGLLSLTLGMPAAFYSTHQGLRYLRPLRTSQTLARLIEADQPPSERLVLEVEKDDPFEYEQLAGLVF